MFRSPPQLLSEKTSLQNFAKFTGKQVRWKTCFNEITVHENCPYSEFFWPAFSCIRTEYSVCLRIQSECGKIRTRILE